MQEGANETSRLGRALALALCTLWGNILFLDGLGSVLLSAPFASRMASMAFSVVGFAAAWLVARAQLPRCAAASPFWACARFFRVRGHSCIFPGWHGCLNASTRCPRLCSRLPLHFYWWRAVKFTLR